MNKIFHESKICHKQKIPTNKNPCTQLFAHFPTQALLLERACKVKVENDQSVCRRRMLSHPFALCSASTLTVLESGRRTPETIWTRRARLQAGGCVPSVLCLLIFGPRPLREVLLQILGVERGLDVIEFGELFGYF
jgi:hypothetical protein